MSVACILKKSISCLIISCNEIDTGSLTCWWFLRHVDVSKQASCIMKLWLFSTDINNTNISNSCWLKSDLIAVKWENLETTRLSSAKLERLKSPIIIYSDCFVVKCSILARLLILTRNTYIGQNEPKNDEEAYSNEKKKLLVQSYYQQQCESASWYSSIHFIFWNRYKYIMTEVITQIKKIDK